MQSKSAERTPNLRAGADFGLNLGRSEEHTSELQSRLHLVCRLLLEKKKNNHMTTIHIDAFNCIQPVIIKASSIVFMSTTHLLPSPLPTAPRICMHAV